MEINLNQVNSYTQVGHSAGERKANCDYKKIAAIIEFI